MRTLAIALCVWLSSSCTPAPQEPTQPPTRITAWAEQCTRTVNACVGDYYLLPGHSWQRVGRVGQTSLLPLYREVKAPGHIVDVLVLDSNTNPYALKEVALSEKTAR